MESGYAGSYTAVKISGQCFKVEPPATSPGYWTVAPGGGLCIGGNQGDVEEFRGDRQECQGNAARVADGLVPSALLHCGGDSARCMRWSTAHAWQSKLFIHCAAAALNQR